MKAAARWAAASGATFGLLGACLHAVAHPGDFEGTLARAAVAIVSLYLLAVDNAS